MAQGKSLVTQGGRLVRTAGFGDLGVGSTAARVGLAILALAMNAPVPAGSDARGRPEPWYTGHHCGGAEAGAQVLANRIAYRRFRERRSLEGAPGYPRDGRWLLALFMGRQPTPGYRLTLAGDAIGFPSGDRAVIRVHWTEPDPGKVHAQVVTRPCLLVALPRIQVERLRIRIEPSRQGMDGWRVSPPRGALGPFYWRVPPVLGGSSVMARHSDSGISSMS